MCVATEEPHSFVNVHQQHSSRQSRSAMRGENCFSELVSLAKALPSPSPRWNTGCHAWEERPPTQPQPPDFMEAYWNRNLLMKKNNFKISRDKWLFIKFKNFPLFPNFYHIIFMLLLYYLCVSHYIGILFLYIPINTRFYITY